MSSLKAIELFYLLFEGVLLFQVVFFGMVFLLTRRRDVLYYSLLNLSAAAYFFLNALGTFLDVDENALFNSPFYLYTNFALLIAIVYMYLLFLKEFFSDPDQNPLLRRTYSATRYGIAFLFGLFCLLAIFQQETNLLFYAAHIINAPFCLLLLFLNIRQKGYKRAIIFGMVSLMAGVCVTIFFTIRYNAGYDASIFDSYPLAIIRIGMLIDILFFQLALLKRWHEQEKLLAMEKLESQLAIEKIRNKISAELHDDLGSSLSGIAMYGHLANGLLKRGEYDKADRAVNIIQKSANEVVYKLGDLVWATKAENDSMMSTLERIQFYGKEMCHAKNMQFEFHAKKPDGFREPDMETRKHVYLFAKEAINNAVKYSDASVITCKVIIKYPQLKLTIGDNGKGFDSANISKGNGLSNLRSRAEAVNAQYTIQSSPGGGTTVELVLDDYVL